MTYVPTMYDWPAEVQPLHMLIRAGGDAVNGGMTLGGVSVENPEPGGRVEVQMEFSSQVTDDAARLAGWIISRALGGAVFRIPIPGKHRQLVQDDVLGINTSTGINWSNNLPWDGGMMWRSDPLAPIFTAASAGETSLRVNLTAWGSVLKVGHVFGLYVDGQHFVHQVMDSNGTLNPTLEISPPLRRDVTTSNNLFFRPIFQGACVNAREVAGLYRHGIHVQLGAMRFVEALV